MLKGTGVLDVNVNIISLESALNLRENVVQGISA